MRAIRRIVFALAVLACPAAADTLTSTAAGNVNGVASADSDTTTLFNDPINAQVSFPAAFGPATAQAAQNLTVLGAKGAVVVDGGFASGNAGLDTLSARNSLITTAPTDGTYEFDIFLLGAQLRVMDFAGVGALDPFAPAASFAVTVDLHSGGGVSRLFESTATLKGGLLGHSLTESGEDLGATFFSVGFGFEFGYDFGTHFQHFDLGFLNAGDFIDYQMSVSLTSGRFELGGGAFFGDPNDLDGTGSGGLLTLVSPDSGGGGPEPIPEPGTIALFGLAAAGFAVRRWRRRRG